MPMIENDERIKLRLAAKDFIVGAGSPVINSQVTNALNTNNHMTERIIDEFEKAKLVEAFPLAKGTPFEVMAWQPTEKLKEMNTKEFKSELSKIIKIEKPREEKK